MFQKWWRGALSWPNEYGVTKLCVLEESSIKLMEDVTNVLEDVLYGKVLPETIPNAAEINEYVLTKRYESFL